MTPEELEKYALEKYPVFNQTFKSNIGDFYETVDLNERVRKAFIEGYGIAVNESVQEKDDEVNEAYYRGRKDILKKLPRWKKSDRDVDSDCIEYAVFYKNNGGDYPDYDTVTVTNRLHKGEMYLELSDLEILLKEENNI